MNPHRKLGPLIACGTLAALLAVPALRSDPETSEPGDPKAGRSLFVRKGCIRCHSIWESDRKPGPNLASVGMGRNLYDLAAAIWSHWAAMNAAMRETRTESLVLAPDEVRDIVGYLYYLNYYSEPGDPLEGEQLFKKRGCQRCHALEPLEAEGRAGPPIYALREFRGPLDLAVALWSHGARMRRSMAGSAIPWPKFQGKEVAHLVAFVRSRAAAAPPSMMRLPGNTARGRDLFESKSCAGCHRTGGPGTDFSKSGAAASLSSLVGSLWNHYPEMADAMTSRGMPYPALGDEEMESLLAYIYWRKALGVAGSAAAGRIVYRDKKCAACHSAAAGSSASAPQLFGSPATRSVYALLSAIWRHGPRMEARLKELELPWPELKGEEMRNLIAFLRSGTAASASEPGPTGGAFAATAARPR